MFKKLLLLTLFTASYAGAQVFNCGPAGTAWASTGTCGIVIGGGQNFQLRGAGGAGIVSSNVVFVPTGSTHNAYGMYYNNTADIRAFTATYTFVPNGWNLAFVVQNVTVNPGYTGPAFTSGAGCEGGFYQGFGVRPNNVFAIELSNDNFLVYSDSAFTYSNVQMFQQNQEPCTPNDGSTSYINNTKISTSPVAMNNPASTYRTTTGHTYSAKVVYDGSTVTFTLFDVTAGGSCPGVSCFTQTWSNVSIPSLLNSTTGYIGFNSGVGSGPEEPTTTDLKIGSFAYTVNTATASPGTVATSAGAPTIANPTFSPAAGTYNGPQSIAISSTTVGVYYCYAAGPAGATILPQPDNFGGCGAGTLYTAPVGITNNQTLYATAGYNSNGSNGAGYMPSGYAKAAYIITTSPLTAGGGIKTNAVLH
jgi:hypothetical protein